MVTVFVCLEKKTSSTIVSIRKEENDMNADTHCELYINLLYAKLVNKATLAGKMCIKFDWKKKTI